MYTTLQRDVNEANDQLGSLVCQSIEGVLGSLGRYLRHAAPGYSVDQATDTVTVSGLAEWHRVFRYRVGGEQPIDFVLTCKGGVTACHGDEEMELISRATILVLGPVEEKTGAVEKEEDWRTGRNAN